MNLEDLTFESEVYTYDSDDYDATTYIFHLSVPGKSKPRRYEGDGKNAWERAFHAILRDVANLLNVAVPPETSAYEYAAYDEKDFPEFETLYEKLSNILS